MEGKKYHSLNQNQLRILRLFYKFRIITKPLLQEYLGLKHESTIRRSLSRLEEQEYIVSVFDKSFIKISKPAYYFLSKKGIAILRKESELSSGVLHSFYKNNSLSEESMDHHLSVMAVYNAIKATYGDKYDIFTKQEISGYKDFPEIKPDLYLRGDKEYFITLAHDVYPFITKKRLSGYIEHSEKEGWNNNVYPGLLYVFSSDNSKRQYLNFAVKSLEDAGIGNDELIIGTATIKSIVKKPYNDSVWWFADESNPIPLS